MKVSGGSGELRCGGYVAAALGAWEYETEGTQQWRCVLSASLLDRDEYWMERGGPYELRLVAGSQTLRWRGVEPWIEEDAHGEEILRWEGAERPTTT